jgi:hypothetical protein
MKQPEAPAMKFSGNELIQKIPGADTISGFRHPKV